MTDRPITFGTDGWRAIVGETFTFDNVRACARAIADHLVATTDNRLVIVGHDTRFMSEEFAAAVAEVLAACGLTVELGDRPVPTPAISQRVVDAGAAGGVVITSSHNPFQWNGIKVKADFGGSAGEEAVRDIEERAAAFSDGVPAASGQGGSVSQVNLHDPYVARLGDLVNVRAIRSAGLKVAVDPMYGTGAGIYSELLGGGKTSVAQVHGTRNPLFPGVRAPEPIEENLGELMLVIADGSYEIGLANDGDADRLGLVDEKGRYVDQLRTFALLIEYLLGTKRDQGAVVKSLTTTAMADILAKHHGVVCFETPVGFKHLGPVLRRENALIAGEESGGYAFRGHIPERDGVLAGLLMLECVATSGLSVSELLERLFAITGPHYYRRRDLALPAGSQAGLRERLDTAKPETIGPMKVTGQDTIDGWRFHLDGGWLLFRLSGTEPLVRIYTEVREQASVNLVLDAAQELLGLPRED